ncbi:MAG: hypothetical protein MHM6MM_002684 [Cercozoa sp. M6MM]
MEHKSAHIGDTRADGRKKRESRPLTCELGVLARADGSCRWRNGDTEVVCSVTGPIADAPRREQIDGARLQVTWSRASGTSSGDEVACEYAIENTLKTVVMRELHPRCVVAIAVQVVRDDGALLSCALNACVGALMDAGVPLRGVIGAATAGLDEDDDFIVDPLADEEAVLRVCGTLAFLNGEDTLVFSQFRSRKFRSNDEFFGTLKMAQQLSQAAVKELREVVANKVRRKEGIDASDSDAEDSESDAMQD